MSSFMLDKFHVSWEKQRVLMVERHDDECMDYKRERDAKKKAAAEKAQLELEILRNTVAPAAFDEQARKVYRDRDNEVAKIGEDYGECIRAVKEIQRKEKLQHDTAYQEAIAARSSRSTLLAPSTSAAAATISARAVGGTTSQAPPRNTAGIPSRDPIVPPKESNVKKPLRVNTSVGPLPTPTPTVSAAEDVDVSRTVTFAEVYQDGEAEHKDTIVEYPENSDQWFILKCEKHHLRFTQRPLLGAGKHLCSKHHNFQSRKHRFIINAFGYRVLGCNKELAELNNEVVKKAFANGYVPMGIKKPFNASSDSKSGTSAKRKRRRVFSSAKPQPQSFQLDPSRIITNPKPFHVYYCYWREDNCVYPVMILGWNDQKQGGLEHSLAGTGLLNRKASRPPNCYIYEATNDGTCSSIIAWAPGFQDGGPKVRRRRFPVMFFEDEPKFSWVAAKSLSRFPLFKPDAPQQKEHPFNVARRWIAKKEGFASWEEFEKARKPEVIDLDKSSPIPTTGVPPKKARDDADEISDTDSSDSGSDEDASPASPISNVTEKELQALQEKADQKSGDSDYHASDAGSSLGGEYEEPWAKQLDGSKGRPWAFYSLRNAEDAQNDGKSNAARKSSDTKVTHGDSLNKAGEKMAENSAGKLPNNAASSDAATKQATAATAATERTAAPKHSLKDWLIRRSLSASEAKSSPTLTGLKRVRSEEEADRNARALDEESTKRPRLDKEAASDKQVAVSAVLEPPSTPIPGPLGPFKPKLPLELAGFELSSYEKGSVFWTNEGDTPCAKLYYGEGDMMLGTVNGSVDIVIDPMALGGFKREEIPGSKGNSIMTLLGKDSEDASMRLVFDRSRGSKAEIGKIQVRSFIRWLRSVNPSIRLLEG